MDSWVMTSSFSWPARGLLLQKPVQLVKLSTNDMVLQRDCSCRQVLLSKLDFRFNKTINSVNPYYCAGQMGQKSFKYWTLDGANYLYLQLSLFMLFLANHFLSIYCIHQVFQSATVGVISMCPSSLFIGSGWRSQHFPCSHVNFM